MTDRMEAGGAETHVACLARALVASGEEVHLVSSGGRIADTLAGSGITTVSLPPLTVRHFFRWRKTLLRLLGDERYDVYHAHTRRTAFLLRTLRARIKAPILVTVHARFRAGWLLRRMCYWGDCTIAVSEDLAVHTEQAFSLPRTHIHVIENGIDCKHFSPPDTERRSPAPVRILFASRLDKDCSRGAYLLLSLVPRLLAEGYSIHVTVAGGGSERVRLASAWEKINATLPAPVAEVCGHVDDMASLMRTQDIFVGVSRAAMEAAACGCAVILCGDEGYLGLWEEGNTEKAICTNLCCRASPAPSEELLFYDLCRLLSSPSLLFASRAYAKNTVRRLFSASVMCDRTRSLYGSIAKKPRLALTVGGYFGCGNTGDDLILSGLLSELRSLAPQVRILALTASPKESSTRFGVLCASRTSPLAILLALIRSDAFLCGGGSLLQNKTGNRSLFYYLSLLLAARLLCRRAVLYSGGIGPLFGARAQRATASVLRRAAYISLRDRDSQELLCSLGLSRDRLFLTADPASLLSPAPLICPRQYLCVVTRGASAALADTVLALCRQTGLRPLVLVFDTVRDRTPSRRMARQLCCPLIERTDAQALFAILSHTSLLLSERLHAMIMATRVGTPSLGLYDSDRKIASFAASVSLPALLCDTDKETLFESALHVYRQRAQIEKTLREKGTSLEKKARKDLENLLAMLYNIDSKV